MNKCIIDLRDHTYKEYSFYSVGKDLPSSDGFVYSASTMNIYYNADEIKKRCLKIPKPGDKLWIAPDCIISRDDVRKEYKIKRKIEDADFRVISEKKSQTDIGYYDQFIVSRASKAIVALYNRQPEYRIDTPSKVYRNYCVSIDSVDDIVSCGQYLYYTKDNEGICSDLITGKGTPIVHHSQVPLTKTLPVTLDTLTILENVCLQSDSAENRHNLIMQLQALNQCNWKEHEFTLRMLFNKIPWCTALSQFIRRKSAWPAGIRQMCEELFCSYISYKTVRKDDFELYKAWVKRRLGVTSDTAILSLEKYEKLLSEKKVSQGDINRLFNCTIRITPKVFQ